MILWSIKKDEHISCNSLEIKTKSQIERKADSRWNLDGAAAAWYFDGKKMHDNFVLEASKMSLDGEKSLLLAPGFTPSSFYLKDDEFVTKINSGSHEFEFHAKQVDLHSAVGPVHGKTDFPLGMCVEGTRIERLSLSGTETHGKKSSKISGTAYFQKILVAVPPPQWYWGLYHFSDGSFLTFMVSYVGRAALAGNEKTPSLHNPKFPVQQDIMLYHAPTGRVFQGNKVTIVPKKEGGKSNSPENSNLYSHTVFGMGPGFEIKAFARAYSHSAWKFTKKIGPLPAKSSFTYNEYPAVLERMELKTKEGKKIILKNGVGNMENSWGFLL